MGVNFIDLKGIILRTNIFNNSANGTVGGINILNDDFLIKNS